MPRAFLIKKHSPARELVVAKPRVWLESDPERENTPSNTLVPSLLDFPSIDSRGPYDLSVRSKKTGDPGENEIRGLPLPNQSPRKPIEFSPKIVTPSRIVTPPIGVALIGRATPSPDPVINSGAPLEPLNPNTPPNARASTWQSPVAPTYIPFNLPFYPFPRPATDYYSSPPTYLGGAGLASPPLLPSLSPTHSSLRMGMESLSPCISRDDVSPTSSLYGKISPRTHIQLDMPLPRKDIPAYHPRPWIQKEGSTSPIPSSDSSDSGVDSSNKLSSVVSSSTGGSIVGQVPRYQCVDCNKSYSTYSGLSRHRQFHCLTQAKKSFNCKYCEKVYVSLGALKMHIRTHTLPCKCKLCGKAFSRPWLLQGHIRTHTGEKPFACPHCSRAFADRSNLRAHLQTHSDVKKYSCKACSKTFSRMSLLLKHGDGGCVASQGQR